MNKDNKTIGTSLTIIIMFLFILALIIDTKWTQKHNDEVYYNNTNNVVETTTIPTTEVKGETTKKTQKKTKKKNTSTKKVVKKKKVTKITNVATSSKSEYMSYAKGYGNYNDTQMQCLDYLWSHESGWNPNNVNKSSGACGIPQALPCSKIKKQQGSNDWKAQIRWGINYINYRYKNPCSAWNHFKNKHWY